MMYLNDSKRFASLYGPLNWLYTLHLTWIQSMSLIKLNNWLK